MSAAWLDKIQGDNLRVLTDTPIKPLIAEIASLEEVIKWTEYGHKGKQTGLQYQEGEDPWTSAVGRMKQPEAQYKYLNPAIKGTILEGLIERFEMFRARLMWVGPYACYSMHRDSTMRIHIPIITHPECKYIIEDIEYHWEPGKVYEFDNTRMHGVDNRNDQWRVHLMFNLYE
jgi:hypothetical protein